MTCTEVRESVAVALLGGTAWDDEVGRHLRDCPRCRAEVARLDATVGLLALADPALLPAPEQPDPALLHRLIAEAARRRGARRRAVALVAAAACLIAVVLVGGGAVVWQQTRTQQVVATGQANDSGTGVTGDVRVTEQATGSQVGFTATGVTPGTVCTLRVVTTDGGRHDVLTWTAGYAGAATVAGTTTVPAGSIDRAELVDGADDVLVSVPVAPA